MQPWQRGAHHWACQLRPQHSFWWRLLHTGNEDNPCGCLSCSMSGKLQLLRILVGPYLSHTCMSWQHPATRLWLLLVVVVVVVVGGGGWWWWFFSCMPTRPCTQVCVWLLTRFIWLLLPWLSLPPPASPCTPSTHVCLWLLIIPSLMLAECSQPCIASTACLALHRSRPTMCKQWCHTSHGPLLLQLQHPCSSRCTRCGSF